MSDGLVSGLYPKPKHANAPDFVIGKLSVNLPQLAAWMRQFKEKNPGEEWANIDMKVSKAGKGYAVVDDWKPEKPAQSGQPEQFVDDDIPF